jgi:nitroreductase
MEALEAVITRRSTRKYKEDVPDRELIEKIIEAGRYAPSGSNSQTTHFMVITDKAVLEELAELVKTEFAKMEIEENTYISLKNSINAAKTGNYNFYYNAPVLIVTANKKGYGNAIADSACALENMMIAANALDLGSCWINQLHWLDENEALRSFLQKRGLKEDETVTGGLILGYADTGMPNRIPLERKGNPVTWI